MRQRFVVSSLFASLLALALACEWIQNTGPAANRRPTAILSAPAAGTTYRGGDVITYSGSASDPEDGALPPARLTWWADFHHDTHAHPFLPVTAGSAGGTVTIPTVGETSDNVWYRFYLVAVDAQGVADTVVRDVQPRKVTLTLATVPAGLQVTLDGQPRITPLSVTGVVAIDREIGAVSAQTVGTTVYSFTSWSDGGAATHTVSTPATNTAYTATYAVVNTPPSVSLTAPATGGSAPVNTPVTVSADASDPDGTVTGVEFFDGPASIGTDASSPYSVTWTPATIAARQLTARATDNLGATAISAPVSFTVTAPPPNQPPAATMTAPAAGTTYAGGDVITYSGGASDPEDGALPPARLTWWADFHHDTHTHPFLPVTLGSAGGTVTIPTVGETSANVWYRFYLVAVDADGAADTVARDVLPRKVTLTLATVPAGLQVTLDGQPRTTPLSITGVVGIERGLGAVSPQTVGPTVYTFASWSDGGAATHTVSTPAVNTTYTATYTVSNPNTPPSVSLTAPANGASAPVNTPVTVSANASDADGTVTLVEFFDGSTSIGSDASSPYSIVWTPQTSGARQLTARATDNLGATTTSAAVSFTVTSPSGGDTEPPIATLTAPADQATSLTGTLTLTATASDNVGVAGVQFQVDGENLGPEDASPPYEAVLPATSAYTTGVHVLRARARDAAGNVSPWSVATVRFGGAVDLPAGFSRTTYTSGLSAPTQMAFAPDGRLFVCEQDGELRVVPAGGGAPLATPFHTFTVTNSGEQGLLGVAFHPSFATNGFVYVYYTSPTPVNHNRVSRVVASASDPNVSTGVETILLDDLPRVGVGGNHNGGALHFSPIDGKLYVAIGDQGTSSNAPSMTSRFGKILRYNDDLTIPTDNPFYGTATGVYRAIWALGLRNPFTFAFQPGTGRMFINDVGQNAWEEINDGIAGSDYGWPTTEGPTSDPRFRAPIYAYEHGGTLVSGYAVVGAAFYNPPTLTFPSSYRGTYFFADYVSGWINRLDPNNGNAVYAFARIGNDVFDLQVGPDGALYALGRGASYLVYRYQFP